MKNSNNEIRKVEDLENGSSIYEIGPKVSEENIDESDFDRNIALSISEPALKKLSSYLLDAIKEDIESRKEWLAPVEKIKNNYLGFNLEDLKDVPFKESTRTYDTTISEALIRFFATTRAELLPPSGPAGFKLTEDKSNELLEAEGERRRNRINNYLTITDRGYYPDFERCILYLGLYGSCFKKAYVDKLLNRPICRFILPEDFIINGDCASILESTRITHVLHLSKREIILNQQNGIYRDVELKYLKMSDNSDDDDDDHDKDNKDGVDLSAYSKRSLFPIYEIHAYLDLEEFTDSVVSKEKNNIPLPYVIAIDKISREVLYIRNNWDVNDPERKSINYFIQYNYLPGFGIYGIGLAHLIGSNAISLTTILRELIDAGKFKNLPAGLRAEGFGQQNTNLMIGPGDWLPVNTGGLPLDQAFMPLPYGEPSQVLRELRLELMDQTKALGSTSEMGMMESREDIPTGTALAFLEVNNRIQSAVQRSIHNSLNQELQLLDKLLNLGSNINENIEIIPVSDPAMNSMIQKIMKAQGVMELAIQAPELHDMTEVFKFNYEARGLDQKDIDKILKPDPSKIEDETVPLDPINENMNASLGKPLKAAIWQEHAAHILTHALYAQEHPEEAAILMAHNKEHQAFEYLIKMQQLLGIELPPLEQIQDPQVQNNIALALAEKLNESGIIEQNQPPTPPDPNAVWLSEVEAREAETAAKERIANLRAETDIFKAQLDFEKEKAKIESNEDIAKLKSETELEKQEYSNG